MTDAVHGQGCDGQWSCEVWGRSVGTEQEKGVERNPCVGNKAPCSPPCPPKPEPVAPDLPRSCLTWVPVLMRVMGARILTAWSSSTSTSTRS